MLIARRHPHFARLLAALATSQLGDWLYNLALLAYVQQRTHSVTWVGVTTVARIAPMILAGPLGGLIADRLDRRRLLIGSDVIRAAIMGVLVLVALAGLPVALVPLLAAAATLCGAAYPPTVVALTPRLVDAESLSAANAARAAITPACVAAGPALGAVLLLIGSPAMVFALNGLTFIVSGLIVISIPAGAAFAQVRCSTEAGATDAPARASLHGALAEPPAALAELPAALAELRAGAVALRNAPQAFWLVGADSAASFVYGAQTVLLLVVAGRLGLGADGYGYLLAAEGIGGIIGASVAGRLGTTGEHRAALAMALVLVALPLPVLAFTTSVVVALLVSVIAGTGALIVEVVADVRLQRTLDQSRIGCAYGFVLTVSIGGIAVGGMVAPILVTLVGVAGALCVIALPVLALALRIGARVPPEAVASGGRWLVGE